MLVFGNSDMQVMATHDEGSKNKKALRRELFYRLNASLANSFGARAGIGNSLDIVTDIEFFCKYFTYGNKSANICKSTLGSAPCIFLIKVHFIA